MANCLGCDEKCRSVPGDFGPVFVPIRIGSDGPELEHPLGVALPPPSPGNLEALLEHMSMTALHLPGTNRQSGGPGAGVVHILLALVPIALRTLYRRFLLGCRLPMGFQGVEHLTHLVVQ